jgi:hypothetical protein
LFNLHKGKWVEELPKVVWSHNTTVSRATGFTPFRLLYREEAMLPKEIKHQSLRTIRQVMAKDKEYSEQPDKRLLTTSQSTSSCPKNGETTKL